MLRIIGRSFAIIIGYIAACLAFSAFMHLLVLGGLREAQDSRDLLAITSFLTIPVMAAWAGYHMAVPAAVMVALAETATIRDWLWHALGGAMAAAFAAWSVLMPGELADTGLLATIIASGLTSGWTYWLIAGRGSGKWGDTLNGRASKGS